MGTVSLLPYPKALVPSADERRDTGKELRRQAPRSSHAIWRLRRDRTDPVRLLHATDRNRLPSLIPIRYGRMLSGPSAFLRGSAAIMAHDLSRAPVTGLQAQICGDAHLGNFGGFATPERALIFDLNDFDETLVGSWEWDVKRLAASVVVSGRENGLSEHECRRAALAALKSYRSHMRTFGEMRFLDTWYTAITAADLFDHLDEPRLSAGLRAKAERKTNVGALAKLAEPIGDGYRIANDPPLITHHTYPVAQRLPDVWSAYRSSLEEDRRILLDRYRLVDIARKVVGVGSVGLRCYVALLLGSDDDDPLFLQIKEARRSVLEPFGKKSAYSNQGKRIASGQRIMQAASDLFLGWTRCGAVDYYVRQLRDMKFSVPTEVLDARELAEYAGLCAWALAQAHAASGDPARIGGYLGSGDTFDHAVAEFAVAYADQTERDFEAFRKAVKRGRITAEPGV
jgi:uncharacterized protein (DUF2252 family)